jgi:exodeoxyribonuclease VII large subunit
VAVYTVSQVTAYLTDVLETDPLLADLTVKGEVSNLRVSSAGHAYFTLRDEQSVLNCVMFRGQPGAELLTNGIELLAHGRVRFYQPRGSTDFVLDLAVPGGQGELSLEFERLRLRLEAEGLFEATRKRPLPQFPRVIGVVTSPTGAVFHDIQNVIRRRYPLVELVLSPTPVQGDKAAASIAAALERLDREGRADVIVLARGGGSLEDLWPFNEEIVARAIYASRTPVVTGVGHETNVTIADHVADARAPTPSAAAELVVPDQSALRQQLAELAAQCGRALLHQLLASRAEVAGLARRMESSLPDAGTWRRRVDDLAQSVHKGLVGRLQITRTRVEGLEHKLRALDPVATLSRGFSVVQRVVNGEVVTSTSQVSGGDSLAITVADGLIMAAAGPGGRDGTNRKRRKAVAQGSSMERLL